MIFEKEKYYTYIKTLEGIIITKYIILLTIGTFIGIISKNMLITILTIFLSYIIILMITINIKIKIQKMKLDIDIYEYIKNKEESL